MIIKMGKTLYWFWRLKYVLLTIVAAVLIGVAAFMISVSWFNGDNKEVESGAFVEQIRDMNALATSQAFIKAVVEQTDNQLFGQDISLNLPGTQRRLLLIVPGTVLAGVNLEGVTENDIKLDEESKTVEITIPRASLLQEPSIDMENVKAFSVEGVFRSNVNWEEGFEIAAEAQKLIKEEALAQGLLFQAEENAIRVLREFFDFAGYEVKIDFKYE